MPKKNAPRPPRTLASSVLLTEDIRAARAETYPGMASWGGETPGHTCRECNYWNFVGYKVDGTIHPAQCMKALAMMNNKYTQRVPHYAKACRYFEAALEPPSPIKEKAISR